MVSISFWSVPARQMFTQLAFQQYEIYMMCFASKYQKIANMQLEYISLKETDLIFLNWKCVTTECWNDFFKYFKSYVHFYMSTMCKYTSAYRTSALLAILFIYFI